MNLKEDAPYAVVSGTCGTVRVLRLHLRQSQTLTRHYASYQVDWHAVTGRSGGADHPSPRWLTGTVNGRGWRIAWRRPPSTHRDNVGASLRHQLLWRRLSTTAGLRVEKERNFGTAVVPQASAALTLHSGTGAVGETRLRGAAGLGIRSRPCCSPSARRPTSAATPI